MMGLVIALHIIICILLIALILIQRGRGGGLVESFSGVESMFGTRTSSFLSRTTTVLSILFFLTCLSLAVLSARQSRSLMKNIKIKEPAAAAFPQAQPQVPPQPSEPQSQQPQTAPPSSPK